MGTIDTVLAIAIGVVIGTEIGRLPDGSRALFVVVLLAILALRVFG
jgi:hypothetical protein